MKVTQIYAQRFARQVEAPSNVIQFPAIAAAAAEEIPARLPCKSVKEGEHEWYGRRSYGVNYAKTDGKNTTEIAAMIRADLKQLCPKFKFSIRTKYFSGGSSIDIEIKAIPQGMHLIDADWWKYSAMHKDEPMPRRDPETGREWARYSPEILKALELVESVRGSYNHDGSDLMTDYHDVRFYGSVTVDWKMEDAERKALGINL